MSSFIGAALGGLGGGAIGSAVVQLKLDQSAYQKELAAAQASGKASTSKMESSFASFKGAAGLAFAAAGVAAVAFAAKAVSAASDQSEALNKTNVVFGESADAAVAFAESSARSFGISKTAALEASSGFGTMLQTAGLTEAAAADMSVSLTELGADLASFNNIAIDGADGALAKLKSGLAGEAEPLRSLGVFLSEARVKAEAYASGIAEVGDELTEGQKVQARYNLILQDTGKAQGDFARTSDGLANQQRILAATVEDLTAQLGRGLLPVVTTALQKVNELFLVFTETQESIQKSSGLSADTVATLTEAFNDLSLTTDVFHSVTTSVEEFAAVWLPLKERLEDAGVSQERINELFKENIDILNFGRGSIGEFTDAVEAAEAEALGWAAKQKVANMELQESRQAAREAANGIDSFADRYGIAMGDVEEATIEMFDQTDDVWSDLASRAKVTADAILKEFIKLNRAQADYARNFEEVESRSVTPAAQAMVAEIGDMGMEGATVIAALADVNDKQFNRIVERWKSSEGNARDLAGEVSRIGEEVRMLPDGKTIDLRINVIPNLSSGALAGWNPLIRDAILDELHRVSGT